MHYAESVILLEIDSAACTLALLLESPRLKFNVETSYPFSFAQCTRAAESGSPDNSTNAFFKISLLNQLHKIKDAYESCQPWEEVCNLQ